MLDHLGIYASDFERSKLFYRAVLGAIGYKPLHEMTARDTGLVPLIGFGVEHADFWLGGSSAARPVTCGSLHIAFRVKNRAGVEAFYQAALKVGGRDNGKPGLRPEYHPHYYGAFVLDPDGHNIEAVCHEPE
ncbi:VOC family protein [Chitinimonas lacunae]|uniref:VOC family protein n=1 Tax=Chitinimonas lacunae TaxID=1963018 RepID=A0ABV8MVV6_9NEIS